MKNHRVSLALVALAAAVALAAPAARAAGGGGDAAPSAAVVPNEDAVRIAGRVLYTWYARDRLRVFVVIDGFQVLAPDRQIRAADGVVWFDEAEAERTGRVVLGAYAETDVEVHLADGSVLKYDSAYLPVESGSEVRVDASAPLRGQAESAPLFLRGKKRRQEFLEGRVPDAPGEVVSGPSSPAAPRAADLREAGVPKEIHIVPRDLAIPVQFTSIVENGMRISTWTGGVQVVRGTMEMAADNVVVWTPEAALRGEAGKPEGRHLAVEAYFEGHVCLTVGRRQLFAEQLYYDFSRETAFALHARIETFAPSRNVPVYYHAQQLRQLAKGVFSGKDAWMTTDQFAVPNYDMGAGQLTLVDLTPEDGDGGSEPDSLDPSRRVRFSGRDIRFRIRQVPLTWWPRAAGDLAENTTPLRRVRADNSRSRGVGVMTEWRLFQLLGLPREPEGFHTYLDLDFWSKRGPAVGVESEYAREDFHGRFFSYYLHDTGEDSIGSADVPPPRENRGWVRWLHRQYLPDHWELTAELSYLSDSEFLNEFFERVDEQDKAQETNLYLKRQGRDPFGLPNDQALTILASKRLNDFYTRTEYLPQIGYNIIGHDLLDEHLTYFQDTEVAYARYRPDERLRRPDSGGEWVADTIHEIDLPLRAGPVNIVPFSRLRLSYFEEDLQGRRNRARLSWRTGARASVQAWRVYPDARCHLLDLHGIRHIHTFSAAAYHAHASIQPWELIPYDVTEAGTPVVQGTGGIGVTQLGWRQRFQTKRGPLQRQTLIDWLTADLEATLYDDREGDFPVAPDGRSAFNRIDFQTDCRVTDSTRLWSDTNYNIDDGRLAFFAVGLAVRHSPRVSYSIGHRLIPEGDTARTYLSADYQINDKWRLTFYEQFDFARLENAQTDVILTRRMNRWLLRLRFGIDPGEDDTAFGIELVPMGAPEVRLGL